MQAVGFNVEHAFEEIVSNELRRLYSAALFMCGGNIARAQAGVVEALGHAATDYSGPCLENAPEWLEDRVVLFLLGTETGERRPTQTSYGKVAPILHGSALARVDADQFYRAASQLPTLARAAVWLVMFSRRPYADVAGLLGISRGELLELLQSRNAFLAVLLRGDRNARRRTTPGT